MMEKQKHNLKKYEIEYLHKKLEKVNYQLDMLKTKREVLVQLLKNVNER